MKHFIKIYHYSPNANIQFIDPIHYGSGVSRGSECKWGKTGANKAYFYIENDPESCVRSDSLYEIYLPRKWQKLIYDLGLDNDNLYDTAREIIREKQGRVPYQYEIKEKIESLLQEYGYKGFYCSTSPQIPHAMVLFEKITTKKPDGNYQATDWNGHVIEENRTIAANHCLFFKQTNHLHSIEAPRQLQKV